MANICDYIKWRGDITLEESEFNEIDNLVLSRLSYFPFDNLINENEEASIENLSRKFINADKSTMKILWPDDNELFPLLGQSKRFKDMIVTRYINKINPEQEQQFSATTVLLPDDTIFVSYRGTDSTIIGWKEDFNMCFKSHITSQKEAVQYLNKSAEIYQRKIRIGGHSKGGNLAVYAGVFTNQEIQDRIIVIFNNDGPGFDDEITQTDEYKKIISKVHTYIPQSSVIGRLLNHEEKYTIVHSTQKGIMQHDLYSWEVEGKEFVCLENVTNGSEMFDRTLKEWLKNVEPAKREVVIDTVFDILRTTEAEHFYELKKNWIVNAKLMLEKYKGLDEESKAIIAEILKKLMAVIRKNIVNDMPKLNKGKQSDDEA